MQEVEELKSWEESGCVKEGRKERGRVEFFVHLCCNKPSGEVSVGCSVKDKSWRGQ